MQEGAPAEDAVDEFVEIEPAELAEAQRLAKEHGVQLEEVKRVGFEPITTVTLVVTGTTAAVGLVVYLIERARGGQVIDLMGPVPAFRRDTNLVYGLVVVLLKDGTVKVEVKEPRGLLGQALDTLKGLVAELAKAPLETAAKTLKKSLGSVANVTAEPRG